MPVTVKGNYNGNQIVIDDDINLAAGQEVMVTVLDGQKKEKEEINLKKYMDRGEKMFQTDAQDYIKELRDSDRI